MRPIMRGLMKFESLIDGSVDLCDIALLNDAIDVQDENDHRLSQKGNQ